jgi:hypothetical protein
MAENQIRLSQLIGYYGPGAMLDLPDRSVLVMGLDHWDQRSGAFRLIEEPRLSRLLRLRLEGDSRLATSGDPQLRTPPLDVRDPRRPSPRSGQPYFLAGSCATRSKAIRRIGGGSSDFNSWNRPSGSTFAATTESGAACRLSVSSADAKTAICKTLIGAA